ARMTDGARSYFGCRFRLDGSDGYLLWYCGDPDGVVVDEARTVPAFRTPAAPAAFAESRGVILDAEPPGLHDLDVVARWLGRPTRGEVAGDPSLSAWTLFGAWAPPGGVGSAGARARTTPIHDKLFGGYTLPAMTPEGEHYVPAWEAGELDTLA